ncbi:acyl-CoA synthetase (AMP-forming)/AMP-acid ligase II [Glaciihabitans tibetensis]|uniref:Acyl-CoA synthetase (AMP-forming)/AMP-acid ligase II n=1 Tax=Glaciihabitans tibetensis TaxID=1266600 RepID=A0A2T0VGN2_9MICO|nr:AMP-binding protein [Glaciihabitans tibetensis]PRY69377.1 acyl-CoA synthetase (AMP-forming)/AMP-acid ligase II [Glaciihabitans tibetensis]
MRAVTQPHQVLAPLVVPGPTSSILHRWKEVVAALPHHPALSSPGVSYTFAEADALTDAIAIGLAGQLPPGESPVGSPIGCFVGHTAAGLLAYLAILKAGRVVVVLDPHLPSERLSQICALAGLTACVADAAQLSRVPELGSALSTVVALEPLLAADAGGVPTSAPLAENVLSAGMARGDGDATAIVFTSGSTGRPKGVIQTHRQLLNDAMDSGQRFRLSPDDRMAMVLPYGFAAGAILQFVALLNGAGLWSFDPRSGGVRGLVSWIEDQKLTTLNCTPHLLRSLVAALPEHTVLDSLRMVSTVGEAVHGRDVEAIRKHTVPTASFVNWVGSSETGTLSAHEIPGGAPLPTGTVPAGKIVANKTVLLLREDSTLAAPGEAGEIVTVSDYMSGEYWADAAGNALRFGFSDDGRRLCRQGDLGRFDENGDLVLLGRADAAVKVRGYLVEPSEIEAAFLAIAGVTESVVLSQVDSATPTRLIAYVVQESAVRPHSPAALRRLLRLRLPEYMVPAAIVPMSVLPRNERGKVDRASLPDAPAPSVSSEPMNPRELVLADIWSEVLGLASVNLDDDFMALGGDSLSAEELFAIVRERFGVFMTSADLLEAPTLREFTRRVRLGTDSLPTHPDVVTLRAGGLRTPIFCFAGSGALALTFLPLSRHFHDHNMYAFQAHGLENRGVPDWSVGAAARRFLAIMRVIQPRGPYLLVGHSFGGLVALEIAQLLTGAGETVAMVTLLDTYLPKHAGSLRLAESFDTGSSRGFSDEPRARVPLARSPLARGPRARTPLARVPLARVPRAPEWGRHLRARAAGLVPFAGQDQFQAFFDHGQLAARRYSVSAYSGRVLLALVPGNPDGRASWGPILAGPHTIVDIASEHTSLLREPHATELARIIQAELTAVDQ